jgi:hypothetical protein
VTKIIEPDSAVDWLTVRQLAEGAAAELIAANPFDPKAHRIDLYRHVVLGGRTYFVRIKLTIAHVGGSAPESAPSVTGPGDDG